MSQLEDIWTYWGRYTCDAAIEAAVNYDEIVLDSSGRRMFAAHPVLVRYLELLNPAESRGLRQHLEYLLQDGMKDDYGRAASETLTNLNTLTNLGTPCSVRFSDDIEFDDGSKQHSPMHQDWPAEAGFYDLVTPTASQNPLPAEHPRIVAQANEGERSQARRDTAPRIGSGHHSSMFERPYRHAGRSSNARTLSEPLPRVESTSMDHQPQPYQSMRPELPVHSVFSHRHHRQQEAPQPRPVHCGFPEDHPPYQDLGTSFHSNRSSGTSARDLYKYPYESGYHGLHNMSDPASDGIPHGWAANEADSVAQHISSSRASQFKSRLGPHRTIEDDEQVPQSPKQIYDEEIAHELQARLHLTDQSGSFDQDEEAPYGHRSTTGYDHIDCSDSAGNEKFGSERSLRNHTVAEDLSRHLHRDDHDGRRRRESRHHSSTGHRSAIKHEADHKHRREDGRAAQEVHKPRVRRGRCSHSRLGPFPSSLVRDVIRTGTRTEFFEALYTLHKDEAPRELRIHRFRNEERTSRYKPLIEELLRSGSVQDIERVFAKEKMDALFTALDERGKGVKDRKSFW